MGHHSSSTALEDLSDSLFTRMTLQSCSSGCCGSTTMLSPSSSPVRALYKTGLRKLTCSLIATVGEDDEVSIKEVADAIVKAIGFEGKYTVRQRSVLASYVLIPSAYSSILQSLMVSSAKPPPTRSCSPLWAVSSLRLSRRVCRGIFYRAVFRASESI
jgi:hypothetical protein